MNLDHTTRSTSISCLRKYQLQYLQNIFSVNGSTALRYGSVFHKAMEGFYSTIHQEGWGSQAKGIQVAAEMAAKSWADESVKFQFYDDYRSLPNMMKAFVQYLNHYHQDEGILKVLEPETTFQILITPTSFEREAYPGIIPFYFTGQIDLKVELNGRNWLIEHKTTGKPLHLQAASLNRSPQLIGYNYAARVLSKDKELPDGSLVSLHQLTAYKSKTTGNYGDAKINFSRVPQIFSLSDLAQWRLSFIADAYRLQRAIITDIFPMRHHSCYTYGPCTYINICEQSRPAGRELLNGYFIDEDPWSVTKGKEVVTVEDKEDLEMWDTLERKLFNKEGGEV